MMKSLKKRSLATFLVLCIILSMIPTVAFAAGETISISAKLGENGEASNSIYATDTSYIYATVSLSDLSNGSVSKVSIDIPEGLSLVSAPGIASIASDGTVTKTDYTTDQQTYFGGTVDVATPTWNMDSAMTVAAGAVPSGYDTVTSYSGSLSYPIGASVSGALSFTIKLQVNPVFVATDDEAIENALLGTVTATMDTDESTSAELPVYVTSQANDLQFDSLSSIEVLPTALNSVVSSAAASNSITYEQSDTVLLSTRFSKNFALEDCTHTLRATAMSFELTVPSDAVVTENGSYDVDGGTPNADGTTTTYTVTVTGGYSMLTSNGRAYADLKEFAKVQFPEGYFDTTDTPVITVDNLNITIMSYDVDTGIFDTADVTNGDDTGKSIDITINDEPTETEYNPTYFNSSSDSTQEVNDNSDPQVLYSVRRGVSGTSGAVMNTWNPIKIEYHAVATGTDDAYLDNVSSVVMSVPFLGDGSYDQYSSQLTKLTVQYETDEEVSEIYSDTLSLPLDVAVTTYADYSVYSDSHISVVYNYSPYPSLTFTSVDGSNPIYIAAEFTGDNATALTTATNNYVYGRPKEETSTEETACSEYYFSTYETLEAGLTQTSVSTSAGFKWKPVEEFALTLTDSSVTENYMYNTAEENTFIMGASYTSRLYGYHNLGSATVSNTTGSASATGDDVVITISENQASNDVVKEIYFPLSDDGDTSQITKLTYKLVDDDTIYSYDDATECPYFIASTEGNTAYTIKTSTAPYTFGVVQAPDGEELEYVEVTLSGWSEKTTAGYAMLRGYLADSSLLEGDTYDDDVDHTISITVGNDHDHDSTISVNSILTAPSTTNMSMNLLGAVDDTEVASGTMLSAHTLTPGLSTVVEFDIMGGVLNATYTNSYSGSWHDITFNVVLPSGVALTDVNAYDWRYMWNSTEYSPEIESTESLGTITISEPVTVANDGYFTSAISSDIESVDIYTCTLDPDVNLYSLRHLDSAGNANGTAVSTIALTITPDATAQSFAVPWSEVLMLGSDASYTSFSTTSLSTLTTSTLVDNLEGKFQVGDADNQIAVDDSDAYLFLSSPTVAMVHDAYVTDSTGTQYVYNTHDEESVPVFGSGDTGSYHFSITDLTDITSETTLTDYAVIPLPVATETQLISEQGFNVTLTGDITCTSTSGSVEYKFAKISDTSALSSMTDIANLFTTSGVDYSESMDVNVIIVKFSDMDYGDSIDVTVPFKVPSTVTNDVLTIKLQSMCFFNSNADGTILSYYSGTNPDANSTNYANSFVSFAYYYPQWDISYTGILVDSNGETETEVTFAATATAIVNDASTLAVPSDPVAITGYTFGGWYADAELTTAYSAIEIYDDTTLYAKFTETSYTVSFDANGGTSTAATTDTVNWTGNITLPASNPTREGYDFAGWYTAASDGTKVDANTSYQSLDDTGTDNTVTLYAQWTAQEFTLTLNYNGGKDATGYHSTSSHKYLWTEEISIPTDAVDDTTTPVRAGYTFDGWNTESDGSGATIANEAVYSTINSTTASNQILYAQWKENTYTIYFDYTKDIESLDGGTIYDATASDTSTGYIEVTWTEILSGLPEITAASTSYKFSSWQFTKDGTTTNLPASAVNGTTLTFADVFEPLLGGNTAAQEITIQAHYAVTVAIVDYYIPFDASGTFVTDTAVWTVGQTFNVGSIDILTIAATDTHASFDGYTFMGWYIDQACTAGKTVADVANESDITPANVFGTINESTHYNIYAKYEENEYTITYDLNYDDETLDPADGEDFTYSWTETMTLPSPERDGYTFDAWYEGIDAVDGSLVDKIAVGASYSTIFSTDNDATLVNEVDQDYQGTGTVYAGWTANEYTITYNVGDSSSTIYATDVTYDDTVTLANTTPTLVGYSFAGWYTGENGTGDEIESGNTYTIAENTTLYANYTAKTFTVDYDYNDGDVTADGTLTNVDWDDAITIDDATRTGYVFDGWYVTDTSTKITSGTTLYSEVATNDSTAITLTAKWTAKTFDIECDDADGDTDTTTATIEDTAWDEEITLADATRTGYDFAGWYVTDTNTKITSGTTLYSEVATDDSTALTLTAKWTLVDYTLSYDLVYTEEGAPADETVNWETDLTLSTVSRSGYTFNGWYLEETYETKVVSGIYGTEIALAENTTLYAKFTKKSTSTTTTVVEEEQEVEEVEEVQEEVISLLNTDDHFAYMNGYLDGSFGVDNYITRAETIVMFSRLMAEVMDVDGTYTSSFTDVDSSLWYANAVGFMEEYGILTGYQDGTFRGEEAITRAEFATVASRFDELFASTTGSAFSDVDDTYWAIDYINSAAEHGWVNGYEDGTFRPDQSITRAEAVTVVNHMLERNCDEDFVTTYADEIKSFTDLTSTHWAYWDIMEATNAHDYTKDADGNETWIALK